MASTSRRREHTFATHEVDIFLSDRYLVTIHDEFSRSLAKMLEVCPRNDFLLGEGPAALLHRIVDAMVDNYRPEVDKLEVRLDEIETQRLRAAGGRRRPADPLAQEATSRRCGAS